MSKKLFEFTYDYGKAELSFEVDLEKFTPEMAYETLTFFSWDYDHEGDPVEEVMKKYALEALRVSSDNTWVRSIIANWSQEGFGPIDGTIGVTLKEFNAFKYDEDDLEMEVSDV
jgi:hypothetical protein